MRSTWFIFKLLARHRFSNVCVPKSRDNTISGVRDFKHKCCTSFNIGLVIGDKEPLCHSNCFVTFCLFPLDIERKFVEYFSAFFRKIFTTNRSVQVIDILVADVINVDKIISRGDKSH